MDSITRTFCVQLDAYPFLTDIEGEADVIIESFGTPERGMTPDTYDPGSPPEMQVEAVRLLNREDVAVEPTDPIGQAVAAACIVALNNDEEFLTDAVDAALMER